MTLEEFFHLHPLVALAFSGGVDSAYLLWAAREAGAKIQPYFLKTPFQPAFELKDAQRLAPDLVILEADVLQIPAVAANPPDRCYHCKKAMFGMLQERAAADGCPVLLDGTNASDSRADRPGMRVLEEYGVLSPLQLCGLTKSEIRSRSQKAGLFTWNKPAYACLATRIPAGTSIDHDILRRVEGAEDALFRLGYTDFRVRVFHGAARIQLLPEQFPAAQEQYQALYQACLPFFETVLLDLKPR